MTSSTELRRRIAEYRAGLDAEIVLLHRLAALAERQQAVTRKGEFACLDDIVDERHEIMNGLVALEAQLRPVRALLRPAEAPALREEFGSLRRLHDHAAALADEILAADASSLRTLREAELARRFAAESLERGETTLAAYRRVLVPSTAKATLVNRRG